ncbi:collagen-like protein, partial [Aphanizomenon sp. 202]|nr:collagen-like protein [Aphanizomenon sp. 202]
MHKNFRYQLPFLLTFCLFTNLLPAVGAVVCPRDVKELKVAGYYDRDGSNGRSGRDGRSGTSQIINADGSAVSLDLSGKDGEDGEDGEPG